MVWSKNWYNGFYFYYKMWSLTSTNLAKSDMVVFESVVFICWRCVVTYISLIAKMDLLSSKSIVLKIWAANLQFVFFCNRSGWFWYDYSTFLHATDPTRVQNIHDLSVTRNLFNQCNATILYLFWLTSPQCSYHFCVFVFQGSVLVVWNSIRSFKVLTAMR